MGCNLAEYPKFAEIIFSSANFNKIMLAMAPWASQEEDEAEDAWNRH